MLTDDRVRVTLLSSDTFADPAEVVAQALGDHAHDVVQVVGLHGPHAGDAGFRE